MLVLTRKTGEVIRINGSLSLKLLGFSNDYIHVSLSSSEERVLINRNHGVLFNAAGLKVISKPRSNFVRFLIDAPKDVKIWREEIWLQMNGQEVACKPKQQKQLNKKEVA
ncbi:carbon storage regulator [Endozoicomonas ascidiicola]|uniref:carbon storage regulator n=1 Tax=Endozoicomonas ascidiicola TaxID=1698521 RepID=UPI0008309B5F|nr:carbon storage regulator [Endozoicomonas ascidiicola]